MAYSTNLFINCPFDQEYFPLLKPALFSIIYCGLNPRISQTKNSDDIRIEEIKKLIEESKYSIHDLSRIEPKSKKDLPRFNMPYELGIDVGCKTFNKTDKKYLVLESQPHRYKKVLSDISGQDIKSHNSEPIQIVKSIRDWVKTIKPQKSIDNYQVLWDAYNEFHYDYETELQKDNMDPENIWEVPFSELIETMKAWIREFKKKK